MPVKSREYEVKLDLFEGPLDLLLYLVTRAEVNIVDISVSAVTTQYLSYLDLMRELNIDVAADYLHMAATLTALKARELLLSVLLFPTLIPVWIGAVKLTGSLWSGAGVGPVRDWFKIMGVVDVLGLALAAWLYEAIQEAGE